MKNEAVKKGQLSTSKSCRSSTEGRLHRLNNIWGETSSLHAMKNDSESNFLIPGFREILPLFILLKTVIGSLGLMDANYCIWNGLTMRSCCVALRTMSRYLQCSMTMGEKIMYTCMCNWVPMLYSGEKKSVLGEITIKNKLKKRNVPSSIFLEGLVLIL